MDFPIWKQFLGPNFWPRAQSIDKNFSYVSPLIKKTCPLKKHVCSKNMFAQKTCSLKKHVPNMFFLIKLLRRATGPIRDVTECENPQKIRQPKCLTVFLATHPNNPVVFPFRVCNMKTPTELPISSIAMEKIHQIYKQQVFDKSL